MQGSLLDRISQSLAGSAPRRATLRAAAGAALASLASRVGQGDAEAKKNKKRCRKRLEKCGGGKKCCNNSGQVKCQIVQHDAKPVCEGITGRRCCGLEGASCDPDKADCDCCPGTFCEELDGAFRCQESPT